MSAYAVPVDWREQRALHTVRFSESFNVPQLAEDLELDIEETMELLVLAGYRLGIPVSFVNTGVQVLH